MEVRSQLVNQMTRQGLLPTWDNARTKGAGHSLGIYAQISPETHQQSTLLPYYTLCLFLHEDENITAASLEATTRKNTPIKSSNHLYLEDSAALTWFCHEATRQWWVTARVCFEGHHRNFDTLLYSLQPEGLAGTAYAGTTEAS